MIWIDTDFDKLRPVTHLVRRTGCRPVDRDSISLRAAKEDKVKTRPLHTSCGQRFMLPVAQLVERLIVGQGRREFNSLQVAHKSYTAPQEAANGICVEG